MTAKGQPRANPEAGSAESTQDDQEPLVTSSAFVYICKPTSSFLYILNEEPINIEAETQRLAAKFIVEAEPMTVISFLGGKGYYLPLQLQDEVKPLVPSDGQRTKHTNDVYIDNVYTDKVKPLEV